MKIEGDSKLIASAFVKACGEMNATVTKDAKGNFGKYATLAAIVEATTGALGRNGLAVVQEAHVVETGACVETWIIHESGATMHFEPLSMPLADRKPQAVGSAITYARRYQLAAICGLAPEDDDGQAAQDAKAPRRPAVSATEDVDYSRQPDNPFDDAPQEDTRPLASQKQLNEMYAVAMEWYRTKENWEKKRPEWVHAAGGGAVSSSKDLSPEQVEWITEQLQGRIANRKAKETQQATVA